MVTFYSKLLLSENKVSSVFAAFVSMHASQNNFTFLQSWNIKNKIKMASNILRKCCLSHYFNGYLIAHVQIINMRSWVRATWKWNNKQNAAIYQIFPSKFRGSSQPQYTVWVSLLQFSRGHNIYFCVPLCCKTVLTVLFWRKQSWPIILSTSCIGTCAKMNKYQIEYSVMLQISVLLIVFFFLYIHKMYFVIYKTSESGLLSVHWT